MRRRLAGRVSLLALAVMVALCAAGCGRAGAVKRFAPGEEVNLKVGEKFELSLETNPSTGFSWRVRDDASGHLAMLGEPVYVRGTASTNEVGGIGYVTFTFQARKAGSGTLLLEYGRPRERFIEPQKAVSIPIVVR